MQGRPQVSADPLSGWSSRLLIDRIFAHCSIRPSRGFCLRGIRQMVMTGLTAGRTWEPDKDNAQEGTSPDQGMVCIDARIVGCLDRLHSQWKFRGVRFVGGCADILRRNRQRGRCSSGGYAYGSGFAGTSTFPETRQSVLLYTTSLQTGATLRSCRTRVGLPIPMSERRST